MTRRCRDVAASQSFNDGVPRMTATQYSKYTLISRPYYDDKLAGWIPDASVVRVFGGSDQTTFIFINEGPPQTELRETRTSVIFSASSLVALSLKPSLRSALNQSKVIYARRRRTLPVRWWPPMAPFTARVSEGRRAMVLNVWQRSQQ